MTRLPAVADRFYPGNKDALSQTVRQLLPSPLPVSHNNVLAAISPHAGYVYSGAVAAETLSSFQIPQTVVILGLNHHGRGAPIALSCDTWAMPMGEVTVNSPFAKLLLTANSPVVHDETAHRFEHSIEVQIPFLQILQPNLTLVPIVLSHISYHMCEELGNILADAIQSTSEKVLLLASSDMTHYEPRSAATIKDRLALKEIEQLNPRGLYDIVHTKNISMCGVIPVTVALIAAKTLGATSAEVIRYTDSGVISGDTDQVVGYAGVVIS